MNPKRSALCDSDAFLDLLDPSLRLLDQPRRQVRLAGEIDRVAAMALVVSIASLVPLAGGAAAAIVALAKLRA